MSTTDQPVANVRWVNRGDLSSNDWNPNVQAPPEHRLLRTSLLENGWTQPIVVREEQDGSLEIVDGYHRWLVAADPEVAGMTGGLVPIVVLPPTDSLTARLATIRHNRARGTHHVTGMSAIILDLLEGAQGEAGLSREEVMARLEMDEEEVARLAQNGGMIRHSKGGFDAGWVPDESMRGQNPMR